MLVKLTMYTIHNGDVRFQTHDFLSMAIVMFALSLNIYEIIAKK